MTAAGDGRGFVVAVNPNAGATDADAVEVACEVLAERAGPGRGAGRGVERVEADGPHGLDRALASLGGRTLVVVGGDGSLHVALARARANGVAGEADLALVPTGTGNDLARTLGIPLDPAAAAAVAVSGRRRALDLLVDDAGGIAVNAVHAGVGADAAGRAQPAKDSLGPVAYAFGALAAGVAVDGWDLEVHVDGKPLSPRDGDATLMVAIANGRSIGGGTPIAPRAEPDDGAVDVLVSRANGALARVAFGASLQRGAHAERPDVATARGTEVAIRGGPIPLNVDGELVGEVSRRSWRVEPRAWTLRAPG